MSSRLTSSTLHAGSMIGSSVRTSSVLWRSVWLCLDHLLARRQARAVAAWSDQPAVGGEQLVDLAGELDATVGEEDQVVADALEVGDEVRGEHDADRVLGRELHQAAEELPPRERVEAGNGLVEQEQLRPLGDRERQRELRALPARERTGTLRGVEA